MWKILFIFFFSFSFVWSQSSLNSYLFSSKYSFLLNQENKNYDIGFFKNQIFNPQYNLLAGFHFPVHSQPKFAQTILLQKKWKFYFCNFGIYQNHFFTSLAFKNKKIYTFFFMETDKKSHNFGFHFSRGEKIQIGFSVLKSNWKEKDSFGIHFKIPLKKTLVSIGHISRKERTHLGLHIPYKTQTTKTIFKKRKDFIPKNKKKVKRKKIKKEKTIRVLELEELLQLGFPIKKALKIHKYSKDPKKYFPYILKLNSYERYQLIQLQKKKEAHLKK